MAVQKIDYENKIQLQNDENDYQIAVVEKAGYGFSDISHIDRGIDTILFETMNIMF